MQIPTQSPFSVEKTVKGTATTWNTAEGVIPTTTCILSKKYKIYVYKYIFHFHGPVYKSTQCDFIKTSNLFIKATYKV